MRQGSCFDCVNEMGIGPLSCGNYPGQGSYRGSVSKERAGPPRCGLYFHMAKVPMGGRQKWDKHHDCQERQNIISSKTDKAHDFDLPHKLLLSKFHSLSEAKPGKGKAIKDGR